jgi:hypothetical protein
MKRGSRGRTRRRRGGVVIGIGANATAYTKPNKIEKLLPEGCEWKDGYVIKVFENDKNADAIDEWNKTGILRKIKIQGAVYPETKCTLTDGRIALFSPFGGQSILEIFYSKGPIVDEDSEDVLGRVMNGVIVRNNDKVNKVIQALQRLMEQVKTMNAEGIYHNDIHEGNIVYDGKDTRLIDFGEMSEEGNEEIGQIEDIIYKLKLPQKGGLRKKAVPSKRRTRKRRSYP